MRSIQDVTYSTAGSTPQRPAGVILVTGSREWADAYLLGRELEYAVARVLAAGRAPVIRHGACLRGADLLATRWCRYYDVPQDPRPADWPRHGGEAGFIRNTGMCTPDVRECLAFGLPCERSPGRCASRWPFPHATHGTQDCMIKALAAGIWTRWVRPS